MSSQKVVVVTSTGIVLRYGYSDFATDGSFDPSTQTILTQGVNYPKDVALDPYERWRWTGASFVSDGKITPSVTAVQLRSPDDAVWDLKVDNTGKVVVVKVTP